MDLFSSYRIFKVFLITQNFYLLITYFLIVFSSFTVITSICKGGLHMKPLALTEFRIMRIIWNCDVALTSMDVNSEYNSHYRSNESPLKLQTIATMLSLLKDKCFIQSYKTCRNSHYTALISAPKYHDEFLDECQYLFGSNE